MTLTQAQILAALTDAAEVTGPHEVNGRNLRAELLATRRQLEAFPPHLAVIPDQTDSDDKWFFIVLTPGHVARVGRPCRPFLDSVQEWQDGNPGKDVLVVRIMNGDLRDHISVNTAASILLENSICPKCEVGCYVEADGCKFCAEFMGPEVMP